MGRLAASYNHDRGTVCVEGISNRRSNGRSSDQLVSPGQKRAQTYPPPGQSAIAGDYPVVLQDVPQVLRACTLLHRLRLGSLELRRRQPTRHGRIVRDCARGAYRDAHLLRHPGVTERRLILITRLMIALLVVNVLLLLAPTLRTSDKIDAGLDRQRRHPGARKRKVVRPEERSAHIGL